MAKQTNRFKEEEKTEKPAPAVKKTTRKKKTKKKAFFSFLKNDNFRRITGFSFILISLYLFISFMSFLIGWFSHQVNDIYTRIPFHRVFSDNTLDYNNWGGRLGEALSMQFIKEWFGISSFLILLFLFVAGWRMLFKKSILPLGKTFRLSLLGLVILSVSFGFIFMNSKLAILGGIFGYQMTLWLNGVVGSIGTALLLIFIAFAIALVFFKIKLPKRKQKDDKDNLTSKNNNGNPSNSIGEDLYNTVEFSVSEDDSIKDKKNNINDTDPYTDITEEVKEKKAEDDNGIELTIEKGKEEETVSKGIHKSDTPVDPLDDLPDYKYPTLNLLDDPGASQISVTEEEVTRNKNRIVETLENYAIQIDKIKATIGPTVTLYEIIPAPGVRISKIKNLEDDIALSLSALGIRIIAPIPGKGTIGIEVPNQVREIVAIKSVLASEKFQTANYELPFVLGKTISNESYVADLTKMPHILMAGATGQGKSVGLNTIIAALLYKKHPAQLKFVLIDPKKVELTLYSKIERHFLAKLPEADEAIITETRRVVRTVNSLGIEMDQRYQLLKDAQVRNIKEYNTKYVEGKLEVNEGHRFMPYIVVIVDEFADLILTAGKEIEGPLTRLAQLARAVGIHLIIATQRPSVNIITGTIKANFPARIAFRVIAKVDSRTILDSGGADQLIGRGDMLLATGSDIIRLQCAFIDTHEVEAICDFIGSQKASSNEFFLPRLPEDDSDGELDFDPMERDELFEEAARVIVQNQHGSTSLIQRKLKLGYNRAGRIIDQLEAAGIVGPFEGSKARVVLIQDEYALEQFLNDLNKTDK